jgi:hypothetical protein
VSKPRKRGSRGRPDPGASEEVRSARRAGHLYWVQIIGFPLAIVGTIAAIVAIVQALGPDEPSRHRSSPTPGRVALVQVGVRNGAPKRRPDGTVVNSPKLLPTIDLSLLNHGSRRVLVTSARIDVVGFASLPECAGQGGEVPISGDYGITLPESRHGTVRRALHQQIPPDDSDRITLRFSVPHPQVPESIDLFALRLRLETSEPATVDAGSFVIATPASVERNGLMLPDRDEILAADVTGHDPIPLSWIWCFRHNISSLRSVTALPGRRSPELRVLTDYVPASIWPLVRDAMPPRAAAKALLQPPFLDAELALYAAEQTKDVAFVAKIRRDGASALLEAAREALVSEPDRAAYLARRAQQLHPTEEGARLLAEALRREGEGAPGYSFPPS